MRLQHTLAMHFQLHASLFVSFDFADADYREVLNALIAAAVDDAYQGQTMLDDRSVREGDIEPGLSPDEVMVQIREKHLLGAQNVLVLVGRDTAGRKFVDWEIAAALENRCALGAIVLPTVPRTYTDDYLPPRFYDNLVSGYAELFHWDEIRDDDERLRDAIIASGPEADSPLRSRNDRPTRARNRPRRREDVPDGVEPPPKLNAKIAPGIGARIRSLRHDAGLLRCEVGTALGLDSKAYDAIESSASVIEDCSLGTLFSLAAILGCSPLALLEPRAEHQPIESLEWDQMASMLERRREEDHRRYEALKERIEWRLDPIVERRWAELPDYPVSFLRDLGNAMIVDWRTLLPRSIDNQFIASVSPNLRR